MATKINEIQNKITAQDATKKAFDTATKNAEDYESSVVKSMKGVAAGVLAAAASFQALTAAERTLSEFESASAELVKVTSQPIEEVQKKILELPPILGSSTELIKAYYQSISAGVKDPEQALQLVIDAAKAANAAHVEQGEVIKGVTKLMAGFGGEVRSSAEALDLIFTIEREGQTSFQELIPVIGELAAISKTMSVSADEMGGALALITQTAGSTNQAATSYKATLVSLLKPTTDLSKMLKDLGFETSSAAIEQIGLVETLKLIEQAAGGNTEQLGKLLGSQEAIIGFSALASKNFEALSGSIDSVTNKAGAADRAFDQWADTTEALKLEFENTLKRTLIESLDSASGAIKVAIRGASLLVEGLATVFNSAVGVITSTGNIVLQAFAGIETAFNGLVDVINRQLTEGVISDIAFFYGKEIDGLALKSTFFADAVVESNKLVDNSFGKLDKNFANLAELFSRDYKLNITSDVDVANVQQDAENAIDSAKKISEDQINITRDGLLIQEVLEEESRQRRLDAEREVALANEVYAFEQAQKELAAKEELERAKAEIAVRWEEYAAERREALLEVASDSFGNFADAFSQINELMGSENDAFFQAYKATAIAQAIIDTYKAAQAAYAWGAAAGGPITGAVAAAAAIAAGAANVAAIAATEPGSSSVSDTSGSSSTVSSESTTASQPVPSTDQGSGQSINITVQGNIVDQGQFVKSLADEFKKSSSRDGVSFGFAVAGG